MTFFKVMMSRRIHRAIQIPHKDWVKLCKISNEDINHYYATDTSKGKAKVTKVNKVINYFIN